jgi:hypothetical protein
MSGTLSGREFREISDKLTQGGRAQSKADSVLRLITGIGTAGVHSLHRSLVRCPAPLSPAALRP